MSPARTRLFVVAFVTLMLSLSVFAAFAITRGWKNEGLQREVTRLEAERNAGAARL